MAIANAPDSGMHQGSTPVPDPTKLTTDAVAELRRQIIELMADGEKLNVERFSHVDEKFTQVERWRIEQKTDTATGLAAALAAAEKAVNAQTIASERSISKSDAATSEQIKQTNVTFTTAISGLKVVLDDLKERVVKMESLRVGGNEERVERRSSGADMRSIYSFGIVLILAAITVVGFIAAHR